MPRTPRSGKLPNIRYEFCEESDTHKAACECGEHCSSSNPLTVRRFVQSHVGEHARARVFRPEPEPAL